MPVLATGTTAPGQMNAATASVQHSSAPDASSPTRIAMQILSDLSGLPVQPETAFASIGLSSLKMVLPVKAGPLLAPRQPTERPKTPQIGFSEAPRPTEDGRERLLRSQDSLQPWFAKISIDQSSHRKISQSSPSQPWTCLHKYAFNRNIVTCVHLQKQGAHRARVFCWYSPDLSK